MIQQCWLYVYTEFIVIRWSAMSLACSVAYKVGVCSLQKKWLLFGFGSVLQKNCSCQFYLQLYQINCSFFLVGFYIRLSAPSFIYASTVWQWLRNDVPYFHAEFFLVIVSQCDSELEVQRYGMKKNTLTVYVSYHVGSWIVNETVQKTVPQTTKVGFWKLNWRKWVFGFWILRSVWIGF